MSLFATLIHSFGSWFVLPTAETDEPEEPAQSGYLQGAAKRARAIDVEQTPTTTQQLQAAANRPGRSQSVSVSREPPIQANDLARTPEICFTNGRAGYWILVDEEAVIDVREHD